MSDYSLVRADASDAEAILACADAAYAKNLLTIATYPEDRQNLTSPDELHAWKLSSITTRLNADYASYIEAVSTESDGHVLGFAGYYHHGHFSSKSAASTIHPSQSNVHGIGTPKFPACMDTSVRDRFLEALDCQRKLIWGSNLNFWYLAVVAVDPQFQRQGIGVALLTYVVQQAETDGWPLYAEAAPEGAKLYEKLGFDEEGLFSLLDGAHVVRGFVKRPR